MGKDPLPDEEIGLHLAELPGWVREEDAITRTFGIRYHGGVAMIVNVADVERLVGHHADIDLRWDHVRFRITTHDAGHRLTAADFDLAARIDRIAAAHQAQAHNA
ncbi:4a-hydroxytetrahydrobiopterin dehydratase [Streptomyces microflavus]|uniref:Putative pterin-4-alpha-carbinolamine dehydratase n=1 Tax=Streptomyces microflavus TaxID=1919 RepID=A0ABV1PVY5_STRMI|nr:MULTISPECIES: 4a-hydroxytetrahydrobiopterin dehydratase [Streptomyces]QQZ55688.1 4a-hydroxytetrahydrobiopterin dehydratase [Streptomyces microflavus]QTA33835.1 4a-hydroxytetrahydrobiopterin dehydratase [Streptomyces sp. CA-256286]WTF70972.1 4a-hydroxytetrahydrobiopterin dehydratase [Streptomyces microflavus]